MNVMIWQKSISNQYTYVHSALKLDKIVKFWEVLDLAIEQY